MVPIGTFVILGWHCFSVHVHGSSSHQGVIVSQADVEAFSGWSLSDLARILSVGSVSGLLILGYSESVAHPDQFADLDRYRTPRAIVPE